MLKNSLLLSEVCDCWVQMSAKKLYLSEVCDQQY